MLAVEPSPQFPLKINIRSQLLLSVTAKPQRIPVGVIFLMSPSNPLPFSIHANFSIFRAVHWEISTFKQMSPKRPSRTVPLLLAIPSKELLQSTQTHILPIRKRNTLNIVSSRIIPSLIRTMVMM
jgi:hypothetical protein